MHSIPLSTKEALFNKGEDDPLTLDEQALWDEYVEWDQPVKIVIEQGDPALRDALKIYTYLRENDILPWEKLQRIISRDIPVVTQPVVKPAPTNLLSKWLLSAAAVLAVFIVGSYMTDRFTPDQPMMAEVTIKGARVLPDGSFVTLDTISSLQYSKRLSSHGRSVNLAGEAFFKVKSDSLNPFTVNIGSTQVIARGTAFNVNGHATDSTVITLLEGKLLIKTSKQARLISAGKQATVKNNTITISDTANVNKILKWKPVIRFDGQTLQSVMKQIHQHYKINYTTQPGLSPLTVSGRVSTANPIENIIKVLNDVNASMRFEIINHRIIVSKK